MKNHVFSCCCENEWKTFYCFLHIQHTKHTFIYIKYNSIWPPFLPHLLYLPFKHTMKSLYIVSVERWSEGGLILGWIWMCVFYYYSIPGHLHITLILNVLKYKIKVFLIHLSEPHTPQNNFPFSQNFPFYFFF